MKFHPWILALAAGSAFAQNRAVSAYLNPDDDFRGDIRIKEVRVPAEGLTAYTYWCSLGWADGNVSGYGGMQYTPDGFQYRYSIWNDSAVVAWKDTGMQTSTFGGEGTGVTSWTYAYPWKTGAWVVLADRAWDQGGRTSFAFAVRDPVAGIWRHLVTWDVPRIRARFGGRSYNFLEDWSGTGQNYREFHSRRGWKRDASSLRWFSIDRETFSLYDADTLPGGPCTTYKHAWAAGTRTDGDGKPYWYMGAGGSVQCTWNLGAAFDIPRSATAPSQDYGVLKIASFRAEPDAAAARLVVSWTVDSTTVPQFSTRIEVRDADGALLLAKADTLPQRRSDTLDIAGLPPSPRGYRAALRAVDLFGDTAAAVQAEFGATTRAFRAGEPFGRILSQVRFRADRSGVRATNGSGRPVRIGVSDLRGRRLGPTVVLEAGEDGALPGGAGVHLVDLESGDETGRRVVAF